MAITVASLLVELGTKGADAVERDLRGLGTTIDATGKKGRGLFATMFGVGGGILGAQIVTSTFRTIKNGFVDMVMGASNLAEAQSKVNVVFTKSAPTVSKWAKTTSTAFGITETAALDTAGTLGNLFTNMGLTDDAAADMSMSITELSGDLSSFFNVSQPQIIDAMTSAFVGEYDALQRLGIPINAAAVEQYALNNGIWDGVDAMTDAERAQAVYGLVLENTTNAQGDFARTSDEAANQMRILSATWSELTTRIGGAFLPVANQFLSWAIDAVDYAGALADAWGAGGFGAVIDKIASDIGNIIVDVPAVTIRILDWIVNTAKSAWQGIKDWWNGGTTQGGSSNPGGLAGIGAGLAGRYGGGGGGGEALEVPSVPVRIRDWFVQATGGDLIGKIKQKVISMIMGGDSGGDGTGGATYGGITIEQAIKVQLTNWALDVLDRDASGDITPGEVQGWVEDAMEGILGIDIEVQDGKIKIVNPTDDLTLADVQGWVDDALEGILGVDIEIQDAKLKIDNPENDLTLADVQQWVDDAMEGFLGVDIEIQDLKLGFGEIDLTPAFDAIDGAIQDVQDAWDGIKNFDLSAPDINWPDAFVMSEIPFVSDMMALLGDIGKLFGEMEWSFDIGLPDVNWPSADSLIDLIPEEIRDFLSDPWGWAKDNIPGMGGGGGGGGSGQETKANANVFTSGGSGGGGGGLFAGLKEDASRAFDEARTVIATGMSGLTAMISNGAATATTAYSSLMALIGPATQKPMMVAQMAVSAGMAAITAGLVNGAATSSSAYASLMTLIGPATQKPLNVAQSAVNSAMANIVATVANSLSTVVSVTTSLMGSARTAVVSAMAQIVQAGASGMASYRNAVQSGMNGAVNAVRSGVSAMVGAASTGRGQMSSAGVSIGAALGQGIAAGIRGMIGSVAAAASAIVTTAISSAKRAGGIASPSKVMRLDVGRNLGLGAVLGVEDLFPRMDAAMDRLVSIPSIDPYGGRLAVNSAYGGSFATAPVAAAQPIIIVTLASEEWVEVATAARTAPERTLAVMRKAESLTVVNGGV